MPTDAGLAQPPGDEKAVKRKPKRKPRIKPALRKLQGRRGPPGKYDPARTPDKAYNLSLLGLKDVEIAQALDIVEDTLNDWKIRYPEISVSIKEGRESADSLVARRLFDRATGMTQKVEKAVATRAGVEIIEITETLAPDVRAQQIWLYNRQPGRWRDRRNVEVSGGLEVQIAAMPTAERLERLRELQAKAGLLLDGQPPMIDVTPDKKG